MKQVKYYIVELIFYKTALTIKTRTMLTQLKQQHGYYIHRHHHHLLHTMSEKSPEINKNCTLLLHAKL